MSNKIENKEEKEGSAIRKELYFSDADYDYLAHCSRYGRKPDPNNIENMALKKLTPEQITNTIVKNENNVAFAISLLAHGNVESPSTLINNHKREVSNQKMQPLRGSKIVQTATAAKTAIQQIGKTIGRID